MYLVSNALTFLGASSLAYFALRLYNFVSPYLRPSTLQKYKHGSKPAWALVTGASDGLGYKFAVELATAGFNVAVHGRNAAKLNKVTNDLQQAFPHRKFRGVVCDAGSASAQEIERAAHELDDVNLSILINNLGISNMIAPLSHNSAEQVDLYTNVNARFPIQLTRALMPRFVSAEGPSLIMNIGSLAASMSCYATAYGGSKAFDVGFSSSLAMEMGAEDLAEKIEVILVGVGRITDAGGTTIDPSLFTPDSKTMAQAALSRVGCGKSVLPGYFWHAVQMSFLDSLPSSVTLGFIGPILRARWHEEQKKL